MNIGKGKPQKEVGKKSSEHNKKKTQNFNYTSQFRYKTQVAEDKLVQYFSKPVQGCLVHQASKADCNVTKKSCT